MLTWVTGLGCLTLIAVPVRDPAQAQDRGPPWGRSRRFLRPGALSVELHVQREPAVSSTDEPNNRVQAGRLRVEAIDQFPEHVIRAGWVTHHMRQAIPISLRLIPPLLSLPPASAQALPARSPDRSRQDGWGGAALAVRAWKSQVRSGRSFTLHAVDFSKPGWPSLTARQGRCARSTGKRSGAGCVGESARVAHVSVMRPQAGHSSLVGWDRRLLVPWRGGPWTTVQ